LSKTHNDLVTTTRAFKKWMDIFEHGLTSTGQTYLQWLTNKKYYIPKQQQFRIYHSYICD